MISGHFSQKALVFAKSKAFCTLCSKLEIYAMKHTKDGIKYLILIKKHNFNFPISGLKSACSRGGIFLVIY